VTINNRGLFGQPILPYIDYRSYAGADVFLDLTFLDHTGTPQTPTSATYQLDDMTNATNMIPQTTFTPTQSTYTLQIPGSQLPMTHSWQGSQVCQFTLSAVLPDTSTVLSIVILELCAIQQPSSSGAFEF